MIFDVASCVFYTKNHFSSGKYFSFSNIFEALLLLLLLLLLLITLPLPRDGGMAEDHGIPVAGQLPRVWTRGRKEIESRQRVSGAKSP